MKERENTALKRDREGERDSSGSQFSSLCGRHCAVAGSMGHRDRLICWGGEGKELPAGELLAGPGISRKVPHKYCITDSYSHPLVSIFFCVEIDLLCLNKLWFVYVCVCVCMCVCLVAEWCTHYALLTVT